GPLELPRRQIALPHLRGDEDVLALDAGAAYGLTDLAFVLVHRRGVDVAIAEAQSLLHDAGAGAAAQLPRSEPQRGDTCTFGLDVLHCGLFKKNQLSHFGACGDGLTMRPSGRFSLAISAISPSESAKSNTAMFSASRSFFEVRGIGMMPCWISQRSETWPG